MPDERKNIQPGLFDAPQVSSRSTVNTPVPKPVWDFYGLPHLDYIGSEQVHAYVYEIAVLERKSANYGFEPTRQLLRALDSLGKSKSKMLRERAFTVFMGDAGYGYDMYVIGLGSTNAELAKFIRPFMKEVEGFVDEDIGASDSFMPVYRYDHGHVISYGEMDGAGEVRMDSNKNYGTGLELYTRWYMPLEIEGLRRSHYGKLKGTS